MFSFLLGAALLTGGGFSAMSPNGGRLIVLSTTRSADVIKETRCRWTLYKDALPAASGSWPIYALAPDATITNVPPPAYFQMRDRGGDFFLRVRFVTGDPDPDKETLLAVSQIDFPRAKVRELSPFVGKPAELIASAGTYEFKLPSARIRFDRGTGLLSGYATGWWSLTEWMKRPMAFDFGDPSPCIRIETFTEPTETNGVWSFKTVSWWSMSVDAASRRVKKNFEIRLTTDWQVRGDGRVVSRTAIRPFGLPHILPRVGWAFVLAPNDPLVQYFGKGAPKGGPTSAETTSGEADFEGLYTASVAGCGNHAATRGVSFDAGMDHFALSTLGDNFYLELGQTATKATFCGIVAARQADTERDYKIDLLISPEKTLKALSQPSTFNLQPSTSL